MSVLSQASEDYLKAIYKLQHAGAVATSDLARELDVSAASVTNMVKRLAEMKLVTYRKHRGVTLTDAGRKVALEIIRHHRLLETYLKEVMGYSWEKLHQEAEHLEHHISEEFEDKIDEMLGFPTHDPHGHPIPTRDGEIAVARGRPLAQVEAGHRVVVQHVSDGDPELLTYLEEIGLMPRAEIRVVSCAPFNGPLTLEVAPQEMDSSEGDSSEGDSSEGDSPEVVVGFEVASNVFVTVARD